MYFTTSGCCNFQEININRPNQNQPRSPVLNLSFILFFPRCHQTIVELNYVTHFQNKKNVTKYRTYVNNRLKIKAFHSSIIHF